ncbi:MAG: hypothetical protein IPJ52_02550 [Rhodocyclaceae bacterium]|jgi:hypothetical protein|nr:hypothetical protein [Rhodocyclaceae bacterium]
MGSLYRGRNRGNPRERILLSMDRRDEIPRGVSPRLTFQGPSPFTQKWFKLTTIAA